MFLLKQCSQCGLSRVLADFNRRATSPDGLRSECRACQAVYTKQYNVTTGKAAPDTCTLCGGLLRRGNRHGVCRSNPECKRRNVSLGNRTKRTDRGVVPVPCGACGRDFIRRRGWGANDKLCPACCAGSFWCTGAKGAPGHVVPLGRRVDQAKCRACRLLIHAQVRAARLGIPFTLTWQQVEAVYPDTCPYLGIALAPGNRERHAASPTLDRIEPPKGYVEGNVEVISFLANTMKNNATLGQLVTFAEGVLRKFGSDVQR